MKMIFYLFVASAEADLLQFDSAEERRQWKLYEAKNNWCFLTPAPLPEDEEELIQTYIEIMEEQKVGLWHDAELNINLDTNSVLPDSGNLAAVIRHYNATLSEIKNTELAGDDSVHPIMALEETLSWCRQNNIVIKDQAFMDQLDRVKRVSWS